MARNPLIDDSNQRLLQLLADGESPFEIACELHLATQTVLSRMHRLRARLGAKTTAHLVAVALRRHLIS